MQISFLKQSRGLSFIDLQKELGHLKRRVKKVWVIFMDLCIISIIFASIQETSNYPSEDPSLISLPSKHLR